MPDPTSHLPEPGKEPKGSADDLISNAASGELEKLLDAAERAERDGDLPPDDPFVSDSPTGDLATSPATTVAPDAATKDLEQEVLDTVMDDAAKVRENELDELFAELTKDDANAAPTAPPPTPEPAAPAPVAAVTATPSVPPIQAAAPVGPLLSTPAPLPSTAASKHVGPPFLTAADDWKPEQNSINVLEALPDVETPRGMNWLVRLLMLLNRPFEFLPPDARGNLGYVAGVVMLSAVAVTGYAIFNW